MSNRTCSLPDCARKHVAKGLCGIHYNEAKYPGRSKYKIVEMPCSHCGELMNRQRRTDRANQFCTFQCRTSFMRLAGSLGRPRTRPMPRKELVHVGPASPYCVIPAKHPARRKVKRVPRVFLSGRCEWCNEQFTIVDQLQARFCSDRCGKNAGRSRRGRFTVAPQVRTAIYERDDWICQLCRGRVEPGLPPWDPWAATLDHIECQSWTLIPDHSPSNLRLAHRYCNSVRSDERYYTADVLFA